MALLRAAALAAVPEGGVLAVRVGDTAVCLARVDGEVYALADNCSHRDFPLSLGEVDAAECTVTCEWHGARFDLRNGAPTCPPATRPVPVYPCRVEGPDVLVDVG